jgi:hypothetical protein
MYSTPAKEELIWHHVSVNYRAPLAIGNNTEIKAEARRITVAEATLRTTGNVITKKASDFAT